MEKLKRKPLSSLVSIKGHMSPGNMYPGGATCFLICICRRPQSPDGLKVARPGYLRTASRRHNWPTIHLCCVDLYPSSNRQVTNWQQFYCRYKIGEGATYCYIATNKTTGNKVLNKKILCCRDTSRRSVSCEIRIRGRSMSLGIVPMSRADTSFYYRVLC